MEPLGTDPKFQKWVKELLHDSTIKNLCVTFAKADGTERRMLCTLAEQLIPTDKLPQQAGRAAVPTTQRVFDLEKQEWRSFKWESVKSIQFSLY